MSRFWHLNLIQCLAVYLVLIFVVGTALRVRQYRALLGMVWSMHDRWPHLVKLAKHHRGIFLTWQTILHALLALLLAIGHTVACRFVWPQADLTLAQLLEWWLAALVVVFLGAAMIGIDCYTPFQAAAWDRGQVENQLDRAEHWLNSWNAPAVRILTLGFINPRKLVGVEVRKALGAASQGLNASLWQSSLQVGIRIAFGGSLWLTYVWGHH